MKPDRFLIMIVVLAGVCLLHQGCTSMEKPASHHRIDHNEFTIEIYEARKDTFGDIILKGAMNRPATVQVERARVLINEGNRFTAETAWNPGKPIWITAQDNEGNTAELEFWPDREPPDKPDRPRATRITSNSVELEWNENREEDIKGYKVYYRLKNEAAREVPEIITRNKHEIIGLMNLVQGANRTFQFYLRAVDFMENESQNTSDILEVTLPEK